MSREILIQEDYIDDPWKMLICCILLNQTNNLQVRPILEKLFKLIPDPESAVMCSSDLISEVIKTTGLQNIKTDRIKRLSQKWIGGYEDIQDLPGIGRYGKDSWEIFINKNLSVLPSDTKLRSYLRDIKNPSLSEGI
jgi:endonuclease III